MTFGNIDRAYVHILALMNTAPTREERMALKKIALVAAEKARELHNFTGDGYNEWAELIHDTVDSEIGKLVESGAEVSPGEY